MTQNPQSGDYNAQGIELDFNNMNAHRGDEDAGAGLSEPVSYGLAVTGAGKFRSTSAFLVSGPGTPIWNRGIVFANNAIKQSTFQDIGTGIESIDTEDHPSTVFIKVTRTRKTFAGKTESNLESSTRIESRTVIFF